MHSQTRNKLLNYNKLRERIEVHKGSSVLTYEDNSYVPKLSSLSTITAVPLS